MKKVYQLLFLFPVFLVAKDTKEQKFGFSTLKSNICIYDENNYYEYKQLKDDITKFSFNYIYGGQPVLDYTNYTFKKEKYSKEEGENIVKRYEICKRQK